MKSSLLKNIFSNVWEHQKAYALNLALIDKKPKKAMRLLKELNPSFLRKNTLILAASMGYLELVQQLIPVIDATYQQSEAIRGAILKGHFEVVRILLPVSRMEDLADYIQKQNSPKKGLSKWEKTFRTPPADLLEEVQTYQHIQDHKIHLDQTLQKATANSDKPSKRL